MDETARRFEQILLPHLGAGYNLARWLTGDAQDAEDVVQEAYLRAYRSFDRYRGGDPRAWLLTIVRNTCYSWLQKNRARNPARAEADPEHDTTEIQADPAGEPEAVLLRDANAGLVRQALEDLPVEFREAIVLREIEGLSYKEIAEVAAIPVGTVMSRLARARERLQRSLARRINAGGER